MRPLLLAATCCLAVLVPAAGAQDIQEDPEGYYVLQFDEEEGEPLADFIDLAKNVLQRPISYLPQEVGDTKIRIVGPIRVLKSDFYRFFQAVLKSYDFIVVNYGPEGSDFLKIQRLTAGGAGRGGSFVKAQAPIVPVERLEEFSQDPATLITTSIPLKYIDARSAMGTFNPFFDAQIEQVRNVENSNALVITGFGSNVWGAFQLVQLVDVPPFQPQPEIRKRVLEHTSVDELEPVLTELLSAARGLRPGQTAAPAQAGAMASREVEPRVIVVENGSNALLLTGEPEMVDRLEDWIDILDVEIDPRGFTHVYRLQNTDAGELEEVLSRVLQEEERSTQQARTGPGAAAGGPLEISASVVADQTSNSLIITASDRKYAEIVETLRQLDVRRRQVLVECAIVETRTTINELLSVDVAYGNDVGVFSSNLTGALLNNLGAIDDDGNFDLEAASIPDGGTLARISVGDVPIPLILNWLETNTENRVLSRPSLLTNDNEEAELASEEETAYRTAVTGANSVTTESFDTVTAGIRLGVSPTISAGNYLRLLVRIEVSNFADSRSGIEGAPPDIITREIETPITVPDGHTVILGGLVSKSSAATDRKVPWLGDIPILGWFFRSSRDMTDDRYLYVFITSHIIDTDFALLDEISGARMADVERLMGEGIEILRSSTSAEPPPDAIPGLTGVEAVFDLPTVSLPPSGEAREPAPAPGGGAATSGGR